MVGKKSIFAVRLRFCFGISYTSNGLKMENFFTIFPQLRERNLWELCPAGLLDSLGKTNLLH